MRFHICLYKEGNEVININDVTAINWYGNFIQILTNFEPNEPLSGCIYEFDEFDYFEVDKIND